MVCQSSFGRDKSNTITIAILLYKNQREHAAIIFMVISNVLPGVDTRFSRSGVQDMVPRVGGLPPKNFKIEVLGKGISGILSPSQRAIMSLRFN